MKGLHAPPERLVPDKDRPRTGISSEMLTAPPVQRPACCGMVAGISPETPPALLVNRLVCHTAA